MKKGEATKQRIIEAAAGLYQRQGYHATGLKQVLEQSQAPKGSMYFHFPGGKEELACAAATMSGQAMRDTLAAVVQRAETLSDAIQGVCEVLAQQLEESEFQEGCPVATLALEMASQSPAIQSTCEGIYREWERMIQDKALSLGIPADQLPDLTTFVLASIEGALLLSRAYQSTEPLQRVARTLSRTLRSVDAVA